MTRQVKKGISSRLKVSVAERPGLTGLSEGQLTRPRGKSIGIAHDFNNLLPVILGIIDLLSDFFSEKP